jgi:hypothetical protein
MSLVNLRGDIGLWRFFAAISFLNQIARVPLMLSMATSARDLEAYFIISATSIPIQFIAQDILQYRGKSHQSSIFEIIGLSIFACGSIIYVGWHHGSEIGGTYLVFAISILIYGASVGYLREVYPAQIVLAMEAFYNTGVTILAVTIVFLNKDQTLLGNAIIFAQASVAATVSLLNVIAFRRKKYLPQQNSVSQPYLNDGKGIGTSMVLVGIMVTTQLERLVIANSEPLVLMCITLAAGVVTACRKIGLDDAVVFERLRQRRASGFSGVLKSELKQARIVFYPILMLALIGNAYIGEIAVWCKAHGLFRSLDPVDYGATVTILCIYLAITPHAIMLINSLRQRSLSIHAVGWVGLVIVICLQAAALMFTYELAKHINLAMAMITLTASLTHILFIAICPMDVKESLRLLLIDIAIFILVVIYIL